MVIAISVDVTPGLFPGISKKDTSRCELVEKSEGFVAGHVEGSSGAHLQGRSVVGSLPKPAFGIQTEGKVVVQIKVDQYGNVVEAIPGAEGTSVTNKELWKAKPP